MGTEKLTAEVSEKEMAQYEAIAKELATKHKVSRVHVYVGVDAETNERIVGYLKEPTYAQKLYALDKYAMGSIFSVADELRQALTLQEESDKRTTTDEKYMLGMASQCVAIVEIIANAFKKK